MARRHTESQEMVREFAELKKQGINHFICTTWNGDKRYKPVVKSTAQGVSAYANQMYSKYGDNTSVEVGYFDNNCEWHTYCTYNA